MGFRNAALVVIARIVRVIGSDGRKILIFDWADAGRPEIRFYTGSPDELQPGKIFADEFAATTPDTLTTSIFAPTSEPGTPPRVNVWTEGTDEGIDLITNGIVSLGGIGCDGVEFPYPPSGDGGIVRGIDFNQDDGDTIDALGNVNIPHRLLTTPAVVIPVLTVGGGGREWRRNASADTDLTFRLQVRNSDGTTPAAGTNIVCQYIALV